MLCDMQLDKMAKLGSSSPSAARDAKYRLCANVMGTFTMNITREEEADVAKQLVSFYSFHAYPFVDDHIYDKHHVMIYTNTTHTQS